jgi:antitoxin HicB
MTYAYPAKFRPDETGRVLVEFIDFPRTATDGADENDAMNEAIDCLGSSISIAMTLKEEIPFPSRSRSGPRLVPVPLSIAPKLALYFAMRAQGVNNSQLVRRLGVTELVVRRMLNPKHETKSARINEALATLGTRLVVRAA